MTYTYEEFAQKIKNKYPEYKNIDNNDLVNKVISKYPEYKKQIDLFQGDRGGTIKAYTPPSMLDNIANTIKWVTQTPFYAYQEGSQNVQQADLEYKQIFKPLNLQEKEQLNKLENVKPKNYEIADVKYIDENITNLPERTSNFLKHGLVESGRMLPMTVESIKSGGIGSLVGGAIGAATGAVSTRNIAGTLNGLKAGANLGGGVGAFKRSFELESGFARSEFKNYKNKDGSPVDTNIVNLGALGVGAVNATLETIGMKSMLKTVPGGEKILSSFSKEAVKDIIEDEAVKAQLLKVAKHYGKALYTEPTTEMLQEISNIVVGKIIDKHAGKDNSPLENHVARVLQTGMASLGATLFIAGGSSALSTTKILSKQGLSIKEAKKQAAQMTADEKAQFINTNKDTLIEIAKEDYKHQIAQEEIQADFYNKLTAAGKPHEQAFNESQLMAGYARTVHEDPETNMTAKEWYDAYNMKVQTAQEAGTILQGGVSKDVQAEELPVENVPQKLFQEHIAYAGAKETETADAVKEWQEKGTDSKYFQNWFGDSKVVDEQGKPLVVYHGTSKGGFELFNTYGSNYGLFGQGSYFTDNENIAESYTNKGKEQNKQIYETYLNIQNPFDADTKASMELADLFSDEDVEFKEGMTNEDILRQAEEYYESEGSYTSADVGEIVQDKLMSAGYDGITHIGGGRVSKDGVKHRVYIAFHPEQIKSVNNQGTFSKETGNIYYQEAQAEKSVVDWTGKFDKTPTFKEIKAYINELVKESLKFATLSPDWLIDVKGGSRVKNKILNTGNYKKLSKEAVKRHNKYIAGLEELLNNSEYINSKDVKAGKKNKNHIEKYHYFKTSIKIGDNLYEIIFDTEQHKGESSNKPQTVHLYNITEKKISPSSIYAKRILKEPEGDNNDIITDENANFNPSVLEQTNKGSIEFAKNQTIITLAEKSDASTVVHELGHFFLHDLSIRSNHSSKAKNDLNAFSEWLGYDGQELTRDQHEQFARGFEAWLMEGKAPTKELNTAFENFKNWLKRIYYNMQTLDVELNDNVRKGFENLFKSNEDFKKETEIEYDKLNATQDEVYNQEAKSEYDKLNSIYDDVENVPILDKVKFTLAEKKELFDIGYDEFMIPSESLAYNISPELFKKFTIFTNSQLHTTKEDNKVLFPYLKALRTMKDKNPKDFRSLGFALKNRDEVKTSEIVKKYGIEKEFEAVRNLLEELRDDAISVGNEVGYLENYYPRVFKKGKVKETGKSGIDSFIDFINKKAREEEVNLKNQLINPDEASYSIILKELKSADTYNNWTQEQKAIFVNSLIRGFGKNNILLSRPGQLKFKRMIDKLDAEMDPFYEDPIQSLISYVSATRKNNEDRKFFGAESVEIRKLRATLTQKRNTFADVKDRSAGEAKGKEARRLNYELAGIEAKIKNNKNNPDALPDIEQKKQRLEEQIKFIENTNAFKVKSIVMKRLTTEIQETKDKITELVQAHDFTIEDSIGALVNNMAEKGEIYAKDERIIRELLMSKFSPGVMGNAVAGIRDTGYLLNMSDFTNTLRQAGDLAMSAYKFGLRNTLSTAFSKKIITKEDLGIENIAEEFSSKSKIQESVSFIFKWTGLNALDGFGKNTVINANLKKMTSQAKKNDAKLNETLQFWFHERAEEVKQDLIDGNITDDVILLSYRALADLQPLTRDQLPINYSKFGNLRILYQMKSYAIKSFDVARQDCFSKMNAGITTKNKQLFLEGSSNLLRLSAMLILFNAPLDMLIDWLKGKPIDIMDSILDAVITYPLFNRYSVKTVTKGGVEAFAERLLVPSGVSSASNIGMDISRVITGDKDIKDIYSWSYMPFLGDEYYGRLGGGSEN